MKLDAVIAPVPSRVTNVFPVAAESVPTIVCAHALLVADIATVSAIIPNLNRIVAILPGPPIKAVTCGQFIRSPERFETILSE